MENESASHVRIGLAAGMWILARPILSNLLHTKLGVAKKCNFTSWQNGMTECTHTHTHSCAHTHTDKISKAVRKDTFSFTLPL